MKRKELKALAKKIAKVELKIQNAENLKDKSRAEAEMMDLCGQVDSLEDMSAIDELVLEILEKT